MMDGMEMVLGNMFGNTDEERVTAEAAYAAFSLEKMADIESRAIKVAETYDSNGGELTEELFAEINDIGADMEALMATMEAFKVPAILTAADMAMVSLTMMRILR